MTIKNAHLMNKGFEKLLESRVEQHKQLKDLIALLLEDQTQPLTVAELTVLTNRELNRVYDPATIRLAVYGLVDEGRVVSRKETLSERSLRAMHNGIPGNPSTIYFSAVAGATTPPARTVAIVVEGVSLSAAFKASKKPKLKKKRGRPLGSKNVTLPSPNVSPSDATGILEQMIEKMVEERVADRTRQLQAELATANDKLAQLKSLLGVK